MLHIRFRNAVAAVLVWSAPLLVSAQAQQAPIPLPYTMTTLAGTAPMSATAGTQCPNLPTGVKSTDAYGDGCLAVNGIFGAAGRGGVQVDAFGNVFVADDVDSIIHVINPASGIMTVLAGGGTICATSAGRIDSTGDGCVAATQTLAASQRGLGIDPWGNVFLPGYGDHLAHVVCRTASPLCTAAQIGTMQLVAGCAASTGANGTTGVGLDNTPGYSTNGNTTAAFNNAGTCSTSLGEIDTPRGITADVYGNVYYADTASERNRVVVGPLTSSYFAGNNPLYAALAVNYASVQQGYVYTVSNIAGTGTQVATVKGAACAASANSLTGTALDTLGDGCPLEYSTVAQNSSYTSGIAVDAAGNMIFADPSHGLRVFFVSASGTAGSLMQNAIIANNPAVTPQPGFIYMLAGAGTVGTTGAVSTTPALGNSRTALDSTIFKVTVSPQGNIYIGDSTRVLFYDMNSGYIRVLFAGSANVAAGSYCTGSSGQKSLTAYSDGCAANNSLFTNSNGLGLAADGQDSLYLYDAGSNTSGMLVRKVLAQGLAAQTVGSTLLQNFQVHIPEAGAGTVSAPTAALTTTPDMTAGALTCAAQNGDFSFDCNVAVTATPSAAGTRSATLTTSVLFTPASGSPATTLLNLGLAGTVSGSVLAIDSATSTSGSTTTPIQPATNSIFTNIAAAGVALDGAGNVYAMNSGAGQFIEYVQGSGSAVLPGTLPSSPSQLAVDQLGDVFAVGSGTAAITELAVSGAPASVGAPSTFTAASVAYTPVAGTPAPQAIAVDKAGNLFVADKQSTTASTGIYRLSPVANTPDRQTTVATGFTNPVSLAVDPAGDVYVADKGTDAVYKLTPGLVNGIPGYVQTTVSLSGVQPVAVATDAAGNLYVQDAVSLSIIEVPVTGPNTTVLTGLISPAGIAVDGQGNVYSADLSGTSITKVVRDAVSFSFGTGSSGSPTFAATLTEAGNQSITGSNAVTNTTNFSVVGGSGNPCGFSSSILGPQSAGNACTFTANFVGAGTGTVSDVLSYLPQASTIGNLTLTGTLLGTAVGTTTTISAPSPASPAYSASGTEVAFTVTVAPASGTTAPSGTVAVTVDSTTTNPALTPAGSNGVATVTLTGLTAGSHTISAIYGTTGAFTGSNSGPVQSFSIAQASTGVTWTPAATTQQYSTAIGTGVLNATANAPGSFIYTATPSGGSAQYIHSASYLPIGTYSLGVTFVPADSLDYAQSTAGVASYTVTKASTTAAVGATQTLVAGDGTGNYTSVQAAINALPNGGSVYIKPGTYTGSLTVVQPNLALRGLGGDPTKVILTHEGGAFGSTYPYTGEFTSAQNNGAQLPSGSSLFTGDEGSATLVVAKGTNTALSPSSSIPNGFYGENFTLVNTYDTDTTTATTTYEPTSNGTCTVNAGPAMTYSALYNAGTLCASQALAIWTTSDLAVMNNVYAASLQDTIYAASQGSGSNGYVPARQYWFRGKVTGDVDYIFGDAAAVFDNTSIYTAWHGASATGSETIEAQNKAAETGTSNDYLSGYVMNSDVFTSQSTGMTNLFFGRPYGVYSTWVMLNSYVDQVNPLGYTTGLGPALGPATYVEFNDQLYTDPASNSPDLNGVLYLGSGGNSGAGVAGPRETSSANPGTPMASNSVPTSMTQAQAQVYFPTNFLSQTVSSLVSTTQNWNPTAALATAVNAFVPSGSIATVAGGTSVTLLMRPQTPGLGAISNGTYTIPTGNYTLSDTYNGSTVTLASGTLDASGEAYYTTSTLAAGTHHISMTYSGDANFSGSTSATPYLLNVSGSGTAATILTINPTANAVYGTPASVSVTVAQASGTTVPTGEVFLSVDNGAPLSGTLSAGGAYTFALSSLTAGDHSLSVIYNGDSTFAAKTGTSAILVSRSILQVAANSFTIVAGQPLPAYTASITGFVNGDTQTAALTGAPSLTTSPAGPSAVGVYPIVASTGTLASANYTFTFTNGSLAIQSATRAASVATGDSRTVSEPVFPTVCATLTAALTSVNDDIPASVDATVTNPDGARIQSALNACAGTGQAVRLSMDGAGHNAYLTGPLSMPSGVTLLVDPAVFVYFSRNAQDYDVVPGTHTCGTVNNATATSSCLPLINITNVSNVGIMGYGRLDGRGGDALINAIAPYQGQSWWGLSAIANSGGSQQNPRFIQLSNATNVTLYKITLRDSPLFHVSGSANGFTAWDIKISTPTSSRNTDGIDPDQAQNFTITRSWISDGDDNVAVGASGSASNAAVNMSITNNHFFAGHGESIGSYTSAGVSNILWDSNMSSGNGTAGQGSSVNNTADSNSTGIRIKSGYDRGGVVQNIQYSNSCYQYHPTEVQFTPVYDTTPGTLTPNYKNILMQNLSFLTAGTVGLTGSSNNGVVDPLIVTLDNVSFASLPSSDMTPAPTNVSLAYGPGQVSSAFVTDYAAYVGSNGDTLADNRTAASLAPPSCSFTYLAPELTGPAGLPQTIVSGQTATADVILTPVVGGSAYPTGTVTLTDGAGSTTTVTLPGTADTVSIPLSNLSVGTHTFTATYSGDANYVPAVSGTPYTTAGPYLIIVNAGSLTTSTTALSGVPSATTYGTSFTATATIAGSSPTGSVEFVLNGAVYTTAALNPAGVAQASFNLPVGSYTVSVIYSGDAVNAGSSSSSVALVVGPAATSTALSAGAGTTTLGHPVSLTATVTSLAGSPAGTVSFSYSTTSGGTQTLAGSATLSGGTATASVDLPQGTIYVTATYLASGSYATSSSAPPIAITVNFPSIVGLSNQPIALPYTMSTLAGGSGLAIPGSGNMACAGATDKYGDGCQATAISFTASDDMRAVVGDPFGNVYLSDISAELVRRIAPNGIITNFAGRVTGTACVPSATTGCTPTLVSISKPRGVGSDAAGNIYIADYSLNKVFKVSVANGLMYLVAGTGTAGTTGDGGAAASAEVDAPRGAWGDAVGDIYIADTSGNKIRLVDPNGIIHTFAGTGTAGSTGDGGPATQAEISNPQGVIVDVNLNVYIADSSSGKIRVVCVTCGTSSPLDALLGKLGIASPVNGDIYTIAGGASANPTSYPALGTKVLMAPQKLALDNAGNLYISDGNGIVWFLDFHTANIRPIAGGTSTACSAAADSIGDGCPATQAIIGDGGNGIGVGSDPLGNIYISDTLNDRIRKVSTGLASASIATGSAITQPVELHFTAGDSPAASNPIAAASTEWQLGAPACTANADTTDDCLVSSAFTPAVPGPRMAALTVRSSAGNTAYLGLTGTGVGAGATLDPASQTLFGANLRIAGLAADNAGNIYAADSASKQLFRFAPAAVAQGTAATAVALATLTAPAAVAVDPRGFVYVSDTATGLITQISPAGATATMANKFTTPAGLAVDSLNNLYVSDSSAQAVYQLNPITGAQRTLAIGALNAPAGLAVDPSGNLLVTDPGAGAIYRFNLQTGISASVSSPAVKPSAIATDAAGNLLIADAAALYAVPAGSNSAPFTVASLAPSSLAIDSAGNLYTGLNGAIAKLTRTQGYILFPSATSSAQNAALLESGNQALTLSSIAQSDTADYSLTSAASPDCTLNGTLPAAVAAGGVCSLTATFTPTTYANPTDTLTFNGNLENASLSSPALVQLVLTGPAVAPAPSISLASSPASPVYGQSVTVTATVSGTSVLPLGSVVFTVDGATQTAALVNGTASITLTSLGGGNHSASAAYSSSNGYAAASTAVSTLTVSPAPQTIAFPAPASPVAFGVTPITLSATGGASGNPVVFRVASGPGAISGNILTITGAGAIQITANQGGNANFTAAAQVTQSITVNKAVPAIALQSSANPALVQSSITLTATVSSSIAAPTGSVAFMDGSTVLGTAAITGGVASLTTSSLAVGSHSITAIYSGDANFVTLTSSPLTQTIEDFSLSLGTGAATTLTLLPGGTGAFTFTITPSGGSTFPSAVTLSLTGLPAGATYTFSPSTLAAGAVATTVTLTIHAPQSVALASPMHIEGNGISIATSAAAPPAAQHAPGRNTGYKLPLALAMLLLPFAGSLRSAGRRLRRGIVLILLAGAAVATIAGLGGCGSSGSGFFAQAPQTYTLTVTATSGSLSRSTNLTLTVE